MILDILDQSDQYLAFNKGFSKAFAFLKRSDLKDLSEGRYEIDGDNVYAMVAKAPGRKKDEALLETHEKYIDIQLVLTGTDEMGWKSKQSCKQPSASYDQDSDIQFFLDKPDAWISTNSGSFAVFFPEDAHMPMISAEVLHKVIVKIAINQN